MASAAPKKTSRPRNASVEVAATAATSRRDGLYANNRRSLRHGRNSIESLQKKRAARQSYTQAAPEPAQMRSGQQFRVGNVTSNGRLQLRPVTGDAQILPSPPTSPARLNGATAPSPEPPLSREDWRDSIVSGSITSYNLPVAAATTGTLEGASPEFASSSPPGLSRARSHSFSTVDKHVGAEQQSETHPTASGIKIVVDKPASKRPVSSVDQSMQMLSVSIPHYRLGTPHFSGKGSAVLHSSINTGSSLSTGFRSSTISARDIDQMFPQPPPPPPPHSARRSRSNSKAYRLPTDPSFPRQFTNRNSAIDQLQNGDYSQPAEPTVLLELESQPSAHNQRSLIRLSRVSGQIVAATPTGLIAQITSPNLLDYELLSDFFLTFRSYLSVNELNDYLLTRLRWAISRSDDFGRIVRVRTFVALRHWILNYFVDDFVSDHELRVEFCNRVNQLCNDLGSRADGGGGDLNILGELKRCWRRTCAQYWEISNHKKNSATDDILPGRPLGYMSASIHLDSLESPLPNAFHSPTTAATPTRPDRPNTQIYSAQSEASQSSRPFRSDDNAATSKKADPQHRVSDQSAHIVSCSIPIKIGPTSKERPQSQIRKGPQVAGTYPPSSALSSGPTTSALLHHSRTTSFSDALRANRTTVSDDKQATPGTSSTISMPLGAGSLVRGYVVQPGQPYVESIFALDITAEEKPGENSKPASRNESFYADERTSGANPGMKRFFGSVRRALSNKQTSSEAGNAADRQRPATKRSPRSSQLPLSRSSSRATYRTPKRQVVGGRTTPRVDMLALSVLERYRSTTDEGSFGHLPANGNDAQTMKSSDRTASQGQPALSVPSQQPDPRVQSNVTAGSRSIFIIDDTGDRPAMPQRPLTEISKYAGNSYSHESDLSARNDNRQTIPIGVDNRPATARYNEPAYLDLETPTASPVSGPVTPTAPLQPNFQNRVDAAGGSFLNDTELESEQLSDITPPATKSVTTGVPSFNVNAKSTTGSLHSHEDPNKDQQPQLRRRPGGDLRAVDHVRSLEENQNRQSMPSSGSDAAQGPSGVAKDVKQAGSVSVIETNSSQAVLRPSFENTMAKLAQLPDDSSDDGGIESTLRKLEGTSRRVDHKTTRNVINEQDESEIPPQQSSNTQGSVSASKTRQGKAVRRSNDGTASATASSGKKAKRGSLSESEVSDSSIPLLERGASHRGTRKRQSSLDWLTVSLPQQQQQQQQPDKGRSKPGPSTENRKLDAAKHSTNETAYQGTGRANPPKSSSTHKSFLLDDNESFDEAAPTTTSDWQPEASGTKEYPESFYFDDGASANLDPELLPHPLRHPVTPPKPKDWPLSNQPEFKPMGPSLEGYISQQARDAFSAKTASTKIAQPLTGSTAVAPPSPLTSSRVNNGSHLPFILAFDSILLAQQFTLVEKDALSEVDWRQLIELRWNARAKISSTWYDCLCRPPEGTAVAADGQLPGGVDMCITRFNMVVKWAASEIVLCQDISERVACIVKYIHIARHARRLRNWATMFQITMALVSADISRLKATWSQVPEKERAYLKTLETLISPTRNFHNLREEIDMAVAGVPAPGTDGGCVPFIGIYTHDLIYNSQKPAFAEPARELDSEEALINFERHRTAATIVKHLLRLVDASSKYPFQPVPDVLGRCLWLATLEDDEISERSKKLES